ncbi:MAG: ferritin [Chloroflexi bacterium]|nr:ferritin [Chloroflexota bacterium]
MALGKKEMVDALNQALADELAAIVQYMWHHVMARGMNSPAISQQFQAAAKDEMKHAESLSERIDYLGGIPTAQPADIKVGGDLRRMLTDNLETEKRAIANYKSRIQMAREADDPVTRLLLETILTDEERHAYDWETALGQ